MLFRKIREMEFPAVGMGTSRTFDVDDANPEVFSVRNKIVTECQSHGVTLVDSSPMYGNAEKVLGLAIQKNDPSKFCSMDFSVSRHLRDGKSAKAVASVLLFKAGGNRELRSVSHNPQCGCANGVTTGG